MFTSPIILLVSFYQPFAAVLQNSCSWKFRNIHRETPLLDSLFNNVVGLQACNFIKNRLRHRRFPMNNAKFLRTLFLTELLWTRRELLQNSFWDFKGISCSQMFFKYVLLNILQYLQENICVGVFKKVAELLKYWKIIKNTYFEKHLQRTASVWLTLQCYFRHACFWGLSDHFETLCNEKLNLNRVSILVHSDSWVSC